MTRDTFDRFQNPDRGRFGDNEMRQSPTRSARSDLRDLSMVLHHDTGKAVLVSDLGDESKAKWIPKSLCEIEFAGRDVRGKTKRGQVVTLPVVTVTLPEWIAKREGLLL